MQLQLQAHWQIVSHHPVGQVPSIQIMVTWGVQHLARATVQAILDKLGETERTMAVSGMYGKGSAINGNVLEVAFESEIIYRMMSAPGALEKVNGAADKVAPGYTVRMTHSSGGDDIESTGRALFGSNFRIEN